VALASTACSAGRVRAPTHATITPSNSSFIDLEPGWRLRVVTPILKSGGYRLQPSAQQVSGNTVTLSAGSDFLGYEVSYYAVKARRVEFVSAKVMRSGAMVPRAQPIVRLFELPRGMRHVRLIYLVRVSQADHDMAVVAARDTAALEAPTRQVLAHPADGCRNTRETACSWIPSGIAVVPEVRHASAGKDAWAPAR
jgi:hypothetical protein